MTKSWKWGWVLWVAVALVSGCEEDDPKVSDRPDAGDGDSGDGDSGDGDGDGDSGDGDVGSDCTPLDTDYSPGADDLWDACVSDDGEYHRIQDSISSIARILAFEDIAALIFDPSSDPSSDDFLTARMLYQIDEGLDSRVVRRYDPHYEVPDGTDCTADGIPAMYPDRCVGPARLAPTILDALNAGIMGEGVPVRVNAARAEAALLWFLYASQYKESFTCTTAAKDCDSSYAYYTGGEPARGGLGLARYVDEVDPEAHDRAWDGLLALRCWRDLDSADTAEDLELRDRARDQYDRAVLDGVAAIVRDRLELLAAAEGDEAAYYHAFVQTLGPVLDREGQQRSASDADALAAELEKDLDALDTDAAIAAIDAIFDCP